MIGMARAVVGGKTAAFEFLRIETREDGIYYVAQPQGRCPATPFKLVSLDAGEAVFANPEHDFPKRIRYRRGPDGTLIARVEGDPGDAEQALDYHFRKRAR
jgi:hypothetical protein